MSKENPTILYIITKSNWGGAQKAVFDLATHPKINNQYKVKVLSGGNGELLEKLKTYNIKTDIINIKNNLNPFSTLNSFFKLYKYIKKESPEIVHLHSSKISMLGSVAARIAGVPLIIFTAHGWPHNEDRNIIIKIILRLIMWNTVLFSHKTIAVSENIASTLKAPKFLNKKILVIYNGIEKRTYTSLPKLSSGSPEDKKIRHIVSIGELNNNKAHDSVIKVLPQVKNVHYHIIGEGKNRQKLENLIQKNSLTNRVTLYGHKPNAKALLSQYDLFLLPSKTEALGYVVLEALQAGIPVIARNVGGVPEILRDLPYTKLYKHDTDLIGLLEEPILENFIWSDSRFDFEKMIERTLYLYKTN